MFMGSSTGKLIVTDDGELKNIALRTKATGKVLSVHAEDEGRLLKGEELDLDDHLRHRPSSAEVSAIQRLSRMDGHFNICHISSKEGLEAVKGTNFSCEVTANHLFLDKGCGKGAFAKVNPPLRTTNDKNALFQAFIDGKIDMIGSDHAPHTIEEKSESFDVALSGAPGVETTFPMLMALAKRGSLPLERLVKATSERPAEIFSLNKGKIEIGYDADLIAIDPSKMTAIKINNLHSKCGWTLFEGHEAIFPHATFSRGEMVVEDGSMVGERAGRDVCAIRH